jgi:hypothetical protein
MILILRLNVQGEPRAPLARSPAPLSAVALAEAEAGGVTVVRVGSAAWCVPDMGVTYEVYRTK